MDMKLSNSNTLKVYAQNVAKQSAQESIPQTLSSPETTLQTLLSLKQKVDSLLVTEPRCVESRETIRGKILDLFSKEISSFEKEVRLDMGIGQERTDSNSILGKLSPTNGLKREATDVRFNEFNKLSKQLIKFLNDNYNPHTTIIIDTTHAELLEGVCGVSTNKFLRD